MIIIGLQKVAEEEQAIDVVMSSEKVVFALDEFMELESAKVYIDEMPLNYFKVEAQEIKKQQQLEFSSWEDFLREARIREKDIEIYTKALKEQNWDLF